MPLRRDSERRQSLYVGVTHQRRQLTAFLPQPLRAQVDVVRRQWDPTMCDQIGGHFTLCHDLSDEQIANLDALGDVRQLRVRIGGTRHWGDPTRGIYLDVDDWQSTVSELREALSIVVSPSSVYRPHVTLTHPRTTPAEVAFAAWRTLEVWRLDADVQVGTIDVIEHDGTRWRTLQQVTLAQHAPLSSLRVREGARMTFDEDRRLLRRPRSP